MKLTVKRVLSDELKNWRILLTVLKIKRVFAEIKRPFCSHCLDVKII